LVLACVRDAPESRPDHAVGTASAIGCDDTVLGQGEVEGSALGMLLFVGAQQMAKLIVWFTFSDGGWWCHNKYPMHKFVVVQVVTLFGSVEFLG
jgi:hypothetical protein